MFIKDNQRFNPFATHTFGGVTYQGNILSFTDVVTTLNIREIAEPDAPVDYTEDTYFRTEQVESPYVIYTKKPDDTIASIRWNKIKTIRDNLISGGGCKVGTKWFHSDSHSKTQQLALVMLGSNIPVDTMWKTMDGSFVAMDAILAQQLFVAQVTQELAIFATAESKRVDDSDINSDWPETYTPSM
jgi:hypothetical protein